MGSLETSYLKHQGQQKDNWQLWCQICNLISYQVTGVASNVIAGSHLVFKFCVAVLNVCPYCDTG